MTEFLSSSAVFCVVLTLAAYAVSSALQNKTKLAIFNPILVSAAIVILVLTVLDIPNETYQQGTAILSFLLTPATICLAIGFYQQFQALKKHLWAIVVGVLAGSISSLTFIYALSRLFGLDQALTYSLLPKSITTAIGVVLSEELGGIGAVTTFAIAITGTFGYMIGPALCKLLRIQDPIAQGVAFGTSAHVIGTTKATQINALTGAVSSLSLTVAGLVTVIAMSCLAQFL